MQDVTEHAKAIPERMKPGPLAVRPQHGNLDNAESHSSGKEENLGIETSTLDFLQGEDALRRFPTESLKPALGVLEMQS